MKKIYTSAYLRIVNVSNHDIITDSASQVSLFSTSASSNRIGEREDWDDTEDY